MADYVLSAKFEAVVDSFEKNINSAIGELGKFGKKADDVAKSVNESTKEWGVDFEQFYSKGSSILSDFGLDLDKFASHFGVNGLVAGAIVGIGAMINEVGEQFNQARAVLVKGTGATGEAFKELEEDVRQSLRNGVGDDVAVIAETIANLNTRFAVSGEIAQELTDKFSQFAGVTGQETAGSVNAVADVMAKWNIELDDAGGLLDQLAMTGQATGVSVQKLTGLLSSSQTTLSAFGMSATESMSFLGTLEKNGVQAESALSGLKIALAKFSAEGVDARAGLEEFKEALAGAGSETERLNIASEYFGGKNAPEMVKIFGEASAGADDFARALETAGGNVSTIDAMSKTASDALGDLKNMLLGNLAGMGGGFNDMIRSLLQAVQEVVSRIQVYISPIADTVGAVFRFIGEYIRIFIANMGALWDRLGGGFSSFATTLTRIKDFVVSALETVARNFQNSFNFIFAILDGNWRVAWLNVQVSFQEGVLIVERGLNVIVLHFRDGFQKIIDIVNNAIVLYNRLADKIGTRQINPLGSLSSAGLSDTIDKQKAKIEELYAEIDRLTGASAKKVVGNLGKVKDTTGTFIASVKQESATALESFEDNTAQWTTKIRALMIETLKSQMDETTKRLEGEGATNAEILEARKGFLDQIRALQAEALDEEERQAVEGAKARAKKYVDSAKTAKNAVDMEKEVNKKAESEIYEIRKYYSQKRKALIQEDTYAVKKGAEDALGGFAGAIQKHAKSAEEVIDDVAGMMTDTLFTLAEDGMKSVGEALVTGAGAWESYGETALGMLSDVLESIGKELEALAVTHALMGDFAGAALATAGASAALIASGAVSAMADKYKSARKDAEKTTKELEKQKSVSEKWADTMGGITADYRTALSAYKQGMETLSYASRQSITAQNRYLSTLMVYNQAIAKRDNAERAYKQAKSSAGSTRSRDRDSGTDAMRARVGELNRAWQDARREAESARGAMERAEASAEMWVAEVRGAKNAINNAFSSAYEQIRQANDETRSTAQATREFYRIILGDTNAFNLAVETQAGALVNGFSDALSALDGIGGAIAENVLSGLEGGMNLDNFLVSMKSTLKSMVLKIVVYGESFQSTLSNLGARMANAMSNPLGMTKDVLSGFKNELSAVYQNAKNATANLGQIFDEVFGVEVEEAVTTATASLSAFAQQIQNLKTQILDLGGEIGSTLADALTNGLTKSDYMQNVKKWIRNLIVQMTVFTDSMKADVERIGKMIAQGVENGFSEDSLTTIREQLGGIFDRAEKKMQGVDSLLDKVFGKVQTESATTDATSALPSIIQFKQGNRSYSEGTQSTWSGNPQGAPIFNVTFENTTDTNVYATIEQLKQYGREVALNGII